MSLIEACYQMYKSSREMIEQMKGVNLDEISRNFVNESEINCNRYDKCCPDFLKRYQKETKSGDQ